MHITHYSNYYTFAQKHIVTMVTIPIRQLNFLFITKEYYKKNNPFELDSHTLLVVGEQIPTWEELTPPKFTPSTLKY